MDDNCTTFMKKQQGPSLIDEQHKLSETDSIASTEVKTAIKVDDKNVRNAKSMLSSVGAAGNESVNSALVSRITTRTLINETLAMATIATAVESTTPRNTNSNVTNALDELTASPSSSQSTEVTGIPMTGNELMEMKESKTAAGLQTCTATSTSTSTSTVATTPGHKGVDSDYLNVNDDIENDGISESGDNFLYALRSNAEKVVYINLETPVLDDNNAFLEIEQNQYSDSGLHSQHYNKRSFRNLENGTNFMVTKRLCDEFNSADEVEISQGDHESIRENEHFTVDETDCGSRILNNSELLIGEGSSDDNSNNARESEQNLTELLIGEGSPENDNETTRKNEKLHACMRDSSRFQVQRREINAIFTRAMVDDETSTSSLFKGKTIDEHQYHLDDSSIPHSSMSPADVVIGNQKRVVNEEDEIEELVNHGDSPNSTNTAEIVDPNESDFFTNKVNEKSEWNDDHARDMERSLKKSNNFNDVQSMDAIERRDFINEQEARLNINKLLGNNFSQKIEQIAPMTEELTTKRNASDISSTKSADNCTQTSSVCNGSGSDSSDQLVTTPTTTKTRVKRSRLNYASERCSVELQARNVEKANEWGAGSSSSWNLTHQSSKLVSTSSQSSFDNSNVVEDLDDDKNDEDPEEDIECTMTEANDDDCDSKRDDKEDYDDDDEIIDDRFDASKNRILYADIGACSSICRRKNQVGESSGLSPSYFRSRENAVDQSEEKKKEIIDNNFKVVMGLEPENPYSDWSCEVNSDGEEICTCRDYIDNETAADSEDELPSRDVDLSCYSISGDVLNSSASTSSDTPTSRAQRKRKLTENRFPLSSGGCNEMNSNDRKRLALDGTGQKFGKNGCGSQPSTPTSSTSNIMYRTPRSVIPTRDNPPPELNDWLNQFRQWSHVERLIAVDQLIEHCEPTQVRHMMKVIEPQFQRDFISLLPEELALQVLTYLTPKDLLRAAQTCKSWQQLCDDNLLWKEQCKQLNISKEYRPKRGSMPPISSPWKAAYMRQQIIEKNWRSRPIRDPKILKGHDEHVITCLQFCGNRIVSGSDDNTLKVWSAVTGKCLRTLVGHTGGVWSSQMSTNIIISGSTDRTLKVWNADNGNCIHTLTGHTSTVRCMHLHEEKVVSGSRDATLRVWDIVQGKCLHTLVGHLAAVRCVQYDGKLVVSGAYDYMVKVWNPETEECLHTLQGHQNRFDGVHVVSGSLDTSIRVWDPYTGTCKHTLMGHQSLTSGMELRENILVSGNADSTVKVWDTTNGQCLQTLSGPNKHQSAVTSLQFNSRFVITSSDDGTVKLWDVRTGEFIRNLVTLESGGSGGVVWRIRSNDTKLICAVGSRNGTEDTKLMVLDFDVEGACLKCS